MYVERNVGGMGWAVPRCGHIVWKALEVSGQHLGDGNNIEQYIYMHVATYQHMDRQTETHLVPTVKFYLR